MDVGRCPRGRHPAPPVGAAIGANHCLRESTVPQEAAKANRVAQDSEETMAPTTVDHEGRSSELQSEATITAARSPQRRARRAASGRLLDLHAAEVYSGISAWTLRDLIASGDLPAVRPPRLRRVWIDRADLDRAIAGWKEQGSP